MDIDHMHRLWSTPSGLRACTPSLVRPSLIHAMKFPRNKVIYTACSASIDFPPTTSLGKDDDEARLTGRERRKLRNERRESKMGSSWREEVEDNFIKKVKKQYVPKSAELNMDKLALLGPQWWIFRVSRLRGNETSQLVAKLLARNFPQLQFKVYAPSVHVKTKLKNGTYSTKAKALFPGCAFLWCILNKEVHDFVRECEGVGGFVGAKIDYARKRTITKPRPVEADAMDEIFRHAKEEQEKHDRAFQEEEPKTETSNMNGDLQENVLTPSKPIMVSTESLSNSKKSKEILVPGASVRVSSGNFSEFKGILKKVNRRSKKATVSVTLFGKETLLDLNMDDIVAET